MRNEIDVEALLENAGINRTTVLLVSLAFCIIVFEGFDLAALSYAAPHIITEWHISSKAALGVAFSASLVGMLVGAPTFGLLADRHGRKIVVLLCCLFMGLPSLAVVFAADMNQLLVLRFLCGIGLGGAAPTMIALTAEYAPSKHRALLVTAMYTGITAGATLAGSVAAWIVPLSGWRLIFVLGGVVPIVFGILAAFWMPESLKFLAVRFPTAPKTRALAMRLKQGPLPENAVFVVNERVTAGSTAKPSLWPKELFLPQLAVITLLLWGAKTAISASYYGITSWLPTLLGNMHVSLSTAATAGVVYQIGGAAGGFVISYLMDRRGPGLVTWFFLLSIPGMCLLGYAAHLSAVLLVVSFLTGFFMMGVQFGINVVSAEAYPTSLRSYGIGWSFAIARFGAIAGPIVAATTLEMGAGEEAVMIVLSIPLVIGAMTSMGMTRFLKRETMANHMPKVA